MTHECEKCKSDKMQDLLIDKARNFYCRSCNKLVNDCDVHPEIIKKFLGKVKREETR